jgi:hypothetical protein
MARKLASFELPAAYRAHFSTVEPVLPRIVANDVGLEPVVMISNTLLADWLELYKAALPAELSPNTRKRVVWTMPPKLSVPAMMKSGGAVFELILVVSINPMLG